MTGITDDPNHPGLGRGLDDTPRPQNDVYLVLSAEERAKGFVRPYRSSYQHVGTAGPKHPLRDLTEEEIERVGKYNYAKYEEYKGEGSICGQFWTQAELDNVGKGCGSVTTMGRELSETYARNPYFYGSTYCVKCQMHKLVGERGEFIWNDGGDERVGT